jgi:hypothetical protein
MKPPYPSLEAQLMINRWVIKPCLSDIGGHISLPKIIQWAYMQGLYDAMQVYEANDLSTKAGERRGVVG